ncbi:HGxxPAAW family protein [Sinosporangium album]|nr:HGxxPAAW family protein [Sinosporangium album]
MEPSPYQGSHAGRASSWISVVIILIGFTLGGVALTLGPNWTLFWVGAGVSAFGGVLALAFDIFSDVIVDAPRVLPDAEHHSPFQRSLH